MKSYLLHIDLWKDSCWLVWPVTRKQAEYWYSKKFPNLHKEEFPDLDSSAAISVTGAVNVIFLTKWQNDAECFGILSHECIHIANAILKSCRIKEAEGVDEGLAYTVDFLVRHFTAALTETKL